MEDIVNIVCDLYNIYPKKIFQDTRKRELTKCRQISMYIARQLTELSLSEIGAYFNKDHATVLHSVKAVQKDIDTNRVFKTEVSLLLFKTQKAMYDKSLQDGCFCNIMIFSRIIKRYRSYA